MSDENKELNEQGKAPEKDSTEVKKPSRKRTSAQKAADPDVAALAAAEEKAPSAEAVKTQTDGAEASDETGQTQKPAAKKKTARKSSGRAGKAKTEDVNAEDAVPETQKTEEPKAEKPKSGTRKGTEAAGEAPEEVKKVRKRSSRKKGSGTTGEALPAGAENRAEAGMRENAGEGGTVPAGAKAEAGSGTAAEVLAAVQQPSDERKAGTEPEAAVPEDDFLAALQAEEEALMNRRPFFAEEAGGQNPPAETVQPGMMQQETARTENLQSERAQTDSVQPESLRDAEEVKAEREIPEAPAEGSAKTQVLPDVPAEESAKTQVLPDVPAEESAKTQVLPDVPAEESAKTQILPDPAVLREKENEELFSEKEEEQTANYVIKPDDEGRNTYDNVRRNRTKKVRKENPFMEWLSDNLRYIELGAVIVIAVVAVAFCVLVIRRNSEKQKEQRVSAVTMTPKAEKVTAASSPKATPTPTPAPTGIVLPADALTEQTDGPINTAVQSYFGALDISGAVNGIVFYSDIHVYAYPGQSKDSYLAFVKYNYQYSAYNVNVPALTELFIRVQPDGSMKVETEVSEAESAYMAAAVQSQAAQNMIAEIQAEYDQVVAQNPSLADLIASQE